MEFTLMCCTAEQVDRMIANNNAALMGGLYLVGLTLVFCFLIWLLDKPVFWGGKRE
jgi:hypothetical protein